jgi:hypothetical protein
MPAATFNLDIEQNTDFSLSVQLNDGAQPVPAPINLSNCLISAQIRESSLQPILASFTSTITNAVNGYFTLTLTHGQTSSLPITTSQNTLRYDVLLIKADQSQERIFEGSVSVVEAITV